MTIDSSILEVASVQYPVTSSATSLLSMLPPAQQQRAEKLRLRRQTQFSLGRLMLLRQASKIGQRVVISELEGAAPKLEISGVEFFNSISHCVTDNHFVTVVVLSPQKVGIDIEAPRSDWPVQKAELFCCDEELERGASLQEGELRDVFFTRCWLRKEAFSKQQGISIWSSETKRQNLSIDPLVRDFSLPGSSVILGALYGFSNPSIEFDLVEI